MDWHPSLWSGSFYARCSVMLSLLKLITRCVVSMMANISLLLFVLGPEQIRFTNIFCKSMNFWVGNDGFYLLSQKTVHPDSKSSGLSSNFSVMTLRHRDMRKLSTWMYIS